MDATTPASLFEPRKPLTLKRAKAPFADAVFVCAKCSKKFPGGGKLVRKALKAELKGRRWGKVRLIETKCFDLCPKRRQVLASAATLADRRLVVVEPGFSAEQALTALLGQPEPARTSRPGQTADLDAPASLSQTDVGLET